MKTAKLTLAVVLVGLVAGCSGFDAASRNTAYQPPLAQAFAMSDPAFGTVLPAYRVDEINVVVPQELIVSEANVYYPNGDIVWHGDPAGDRHEQVKAVLDTAFARGTDAMQGNVPVRVDVTLERFHALTPRTRYTVGGVHSIRFKLEVRDAESGLLLEEPRSVKANLKAFGGQRAIDAERQGQTQKVRIIDHLSSVIEAELRTTAPRPTS